MFQLKSRSIIEISGNDTADFLQSLITNDIYKCEEKSLMYTLLLNPQGRFLYDLFIFKNGENFICDVQSSSLDTLIAKLNMYKMRRNVSIKPLPELHVNYGFASSTEAKGWKFQDPRNENLGLRYYSYDKGVDSDEQSYHLKRIEHLVPDADLDLTHLKSLPLDFAMHKINAIDFNKGCYVGQEVTARMNYRGKLRKTLKRISTNIKNIEKNTELLFNDKKIGILLGVVATHGLALINEEQLSAISKNGHCECSVKDIEGTLTVYD